MKSVQSHDTGSSGTPVKHQHWYHEERVHIVKWSSIFIGFIILAAYFITYFESHNGKAIITTYPQALWYTIVTISTVGYGDHYPVTDERKVIGSLIILFAIGFAGYSISKIQGFVVENHRRKRLGMNGTNMKGHYIVIGWNPVSQIVIRELLAAKFQVAIWADSEEEVTRINATFRDVFVTIGEDTDDTVYVCIPAISDHQFRWKVTTCYDSK